MLGYCLYKFWSTWICSLSFSPVSLSLPFSGSLPVSLAYNSIVARSAHCRIPLIGERAKGKNGIKVRWHTGAIRCAVKSREQKNLAVFCGRKNEAPGNFFQVWKSHTAVIVCVHVGFREAWLWDKTNHLSWFSGLRAGKLRGTGRANPSIKTWSISPNNLVYSWGYANVEAAKLP